MDADEHLGSRYYLDLASAFVRGKLPHVPNADASALVREGLAAGLRLHKFKRTGDALPRVRKVLGALRGLAPADLLDVGSGRGTFLWPLLDAFPGLPVVAIDQSPRRAADLGAVAAGGLATLRVAQMDAARLALPDRFADVVTILEVLEHLPDPAAAVAEAVRVARRAVVVTVPSKPDDNPEHIHLFDRDTLTRLFASAGVSRVRFDAVLNHWMAVATVGWPMPPTLHKYPRTYHLEGSRLQLGDDGMGGVPLSDLAGRYLVVEEKLDGANAAVSFDEAGRLWLQSRGHFLTGGVREKHFNLFKQWAAAHAPSLFAALRSRHILYGEWLYAKHTIYYDQLPHYFLEFDVLDAGEGAFLSTARRRELLRGLPIVSVPVLQEGVCNDPAVLPGIVGRALYKSPDWRERLTADAADAGLDPDRTWAETDKSDIAEGLYVKVEDDGRVLERYKFVRTTFLTAVLDSGTHWLKRPIVPNRLADGVDLFGGAP